MEKKFDLLEANLVSTWKYQGNDFCSVCRNDLSEVSLDATAHMDDTTHDGHQVAIGAPPPFRRQRGRTLLSCAIAAPCKYVFADLKGCLAGECDHEFHLDCIKNWIKKSAGNEVCPSCNAPWVVRQVRKVGVLNDGV